MRIQQKAVKLLPSSVFSCSGRTSRSPMRKNFTVSLPITVATDASSGLNMHLYIGVPARDTDTAAIIFARAQFQIINIQSGAPDSASNSWLSSLNCIDTISYSSDISHDTG